MIIPCRYSPIEEVHKKVISPIIMATRFSPPLFRSVFGAICLTFVLTVSPVFAADYPGPVFPGETLTDPELTEPLPLSKRNPLLQRPKSKQVVFDDLDPVDSVMPQNVIYQDVINRQPQVTRQRQMPVRMPTVIDTDNTLFQNVSNTISEYSFGTCGYAAGCDPGCDAGCAPSCAPCPVPFGMGLFDNITLFGESTAFKTGLNAGAGSMGLGEGINWSAAVTPQGSVTAQYGVRAVQGDLYSKAARSQVFMTAGLFKRFCLLPVQFGAAFDWLHDYSQFDSVNLRQLRYELSTRLPYQFEGGFMGGSNAFQDRPTTQRINQWAHSEFGSIGGYVDVQDYYLFFIRKHLNSGGQLEIRGGASSRGDIIMSALGEVALCDRVAVNGGISVLTPSDGQSIRGNVRESWSLSMGVVIYFRGGAVCRPVNLHRPMFDVAGNNSFFTRIVGR